MKVNYDEVYQVELIKELSARVYGRLLNMILEAGYDKTDMSIFECLLLQQFKEHKRSNLFDKNLKELEALKAYWHSMNQLTKDLSKKRVA